MAGFSLWDHGSKYLKGNQISLFKPVLDSEYAAGIVLLLGADGNKGVLSGGEEDRLINK